MANRTVGQTITTTWVQISNGAEAKTVQVVSGVILLVDADEAPAATAIGHSIAGWVTITAPTKAWVRASAAESANIIIS